jgi:hypothetical protein
MTGLARLTLLCATLLTSAVYLAAIVAPAIVPAACDGCVDDAQGSTCPVTCSCACRAQGRAIAFAQPHSGVSNQPLDVVAWLDPVTPAAPEPREILHVPKPTRVS